MPACLAHHQFGRDVLKRLDGNITSVIGAYKKEFDCGLQGPDIFFFYRPYRRTWVRAYGRERHNEPARRMFAPMLDKTHKNAALSYLLGLICHYVLDKNCHPYVEAHSFKYGDHQRMEAAFDLSVMRAAGLAEARYAYLPAGPMDDLAMASLWPGVDAYILKECVRAERRAIRLLDRRKFLETCEKITGKPGLLTPMTLPAEVTEIQTAHVQSLYALYNRAQEECPKLIGTALSLMGTTLTWGQGFDLNHKGTAGDGEDAD